MLQLLLPFLFVFCTYTTSLTISETAKDAARIARSLLVESSIGTMATRYPTDHPTLAGMPFALQEYYASCFSNGSLLLLFLPISRHSQNIIHSPEHAASISVWRFPNPSADQPRVSLLGKVTVLRDPDAIEEGQRQCYLEAHPDATRWLPEESRSPHLSFWARFDPVSVYFVGGFGDKHYIGEIPLRLYQETQSPEMLWHQWKNYLGLCVADPGPILSFTVQPIAQFWWPNARR